MEFAIVAPVCVALFLGMIEAARLYDAQNVLATAAREGARLAAMDRDDMELNGSSINEKIISDVRNYLNAAGLPGDDVDVVISSVDDPSVPFDLDDPANDLELFELRLEIPYSSLNPMCPNDTISSLAAAIVMRNAQAAIVQ